MLRPPGFMCWNQKMDWVTALSENYYSINGKTGDNHYGLTAPAACKRKTNEHKASNLKVIQRRPGRIEKNLNTWYDTDFQLRFRKNAVLTVLQNRATDIHASIGYRHRTNHPAIGNEKCML